VEWINLAEDRASFRLLWAR